MGNKSKPEIINKIKELISFDQLEKSMDLIKELIKTNDHVNFLILQSARYRDLRNAINENIIEWSSAQIEKSKIRKSLLDFIDELNADLYQEQVFVQSIRTDENLGSTIRIKDYHYSFPKIDTLLDKVESIEEPYKRVGGFFKSRDIAEPSSDLSIVKIKDVSFINLKNNEIEAPSLHVGLMFKPTKVNFQYDQLDEQIIYFLEQYKEWYFSAARIIQWGSNQTGFKEFSNLTMEVLEDRLSKLYHRGIVLRAIPRERVKIYKINEVIF